MSSQSQHRRAASLRTVGSELGEETGVGGGQVTVALRGRDGRHQFVPLFGEDPAHVPGDPGGLSTSAGGDRPQHHGPHPVRVTLGVDQSQSHTPRDADDNPPVDTQMFPEAFHVGDQMGGGVSRQVRIGISGQRAAPPASALVEQDRTITVRVEIAPGA